MAPGMVAGASSLMSRLKGKGLKNRLLHPYDTFWDWRLGVNTFGYIPAVGESHDAAWQGHYEPTPYRDIFSMLRHAGVGKGTTYVDLGCGLGRTVFVARRLGADRAVGVEIDPQLASQCRHSAERGGFASREVAFVCAPAETYAHADTTAVFLFHPFGAGTLASVIEQLDKSLDQRPRPLKLIYLNPVFDEVVAGSRHLKRTEQWPPERRKLTRSGNYAVSFWSS